MAKSRTGGRRSSPTYVRNTATIPGGGAPQGAQQQDDNNNAQQPVQAPQNVPQPPQNNIDSNAPFHNMDDTEAAAIRQANDRFYNPTVVDATKQYISAKAMANGFSMSQNLNYKLDNGLPLNANEKFVDKVLPLGMHPIGTNVVLQRGAHQNILESLGIKNYQNYTEQQLTQKLVGQQFQSRSYTSTSYDVSKNPFLTGAQAGGREVIMNIKAPANTLVHFGAKAQSEIILNKNTNFRITGVRYTGKTAYPKSTMRAMRQIELDIEIY